MTKAYLKSRAILLRQQGYSYELIKLKLEYQKALFVTGLKLFLLKLMTRHARE